MYSLKGNSFSIPAGNWSATPNETTPKKRMSECWLTRFLRNAISSSQAGHFAATNTRTTLPLLRTASSSLAPELSTRFAAGSGLFISGGALAGTVSALRSVLLANMNAANATMNVAQKSRASHLILLLIVWAIGCKTSCPQAKP